jgi:molybdopterin-containing oxidoreductase family membrane subunit
MRRRLPGLSHKLHGLHSLAPYLAVVGLCLSMLHQSSLGATYGVLKARPIWFRPDLSVLFMASAMAGGPALTLLVTMIASRVSSRTRVDDQLIEKLSRFVGWVLVGYLYFRFWDALSMTYTYAPGRTEGLRFITKGPLAFNFWGGEILLGAVVPIILLLVPRFRRQPLLRILAFALVVGGVVAYRWDTNIAGQLVLLSYLPQEMVTRYTTYFPSLIEILAGAGVVAYGVLAVTLGVRYLNVVDHQPVEEEAETVPAFAPAD